MCLNQCLNVRRTGTLSMENGSPACACSSVTAQDSSGCCPWPHRSSRVNKHSPTTSDHIRPPWRKPARSCCTLFIGNVYTYFTHIYTLWHNMTTLFWVCDHPCNHGVQICKPFRVSPEDMFNPRIGLESWNWFIVHNNVLHVPSKI